MYYMLAPYFQCFEIVLYVGYHAESTFLALKCILLYIWSVYKYSFGHILQPVQIFLFSVTYFEQLRLSIFNLKKKMLVSNHVWVKLNHWV